jgi:hypothetical protein
MCPSQNKYPRVFSRFCYKFWHLTAYRITYVPRGLPLKTQRFVSDMFAFSVILKIHTDNFPTQH